MKRFICLAIFTVALGLSSTICEVEARGAAPRPQTQQSTSEGAAARRYCWDKFGIPRDRGPGPQVKEVIRCVTQRLGHPDPFMTSRYGTGE